MIKLKQLKEIGYNLFELYQLTINNDELEIINDNPTPNNPSKGTKIIKLKILKKTENAEFIVKYFDFIRYLGPISITSFTINKPMEKEMIPIR